MIFNTTTTTSTSQSIGSLSHGVEYSIKVAAVDRMGRVSENATILMTLEGIILCTYYIREHGSVSLCRDGQKTKWRLQCKY